MARLQVDDFEVGMLVTVESRKPSSNDIPDNPFAAMMASTKDPMQGVVMRIEALNLPYIALSAWDADGQTMFPVVLDTREKFLMKVSDEFAKFVCGTNYIKEFFDVHLPEGGISQEVIQEWTQWEDTEDEC